jgi:hypothetical protein
MLPINYLIYTQKQDTKCYGRIISYAINYEDACYNLDTYIYNKNPKSVIKYNGNVIDLIPLSVPFLLKHKRDIENEYGYYLINNDDTVEWCFVQDIRPLEYFMFNNSYDITSINTLYPILEYEMGDYYIDNEDDNRPIKYIVYIHFSEYCAGVVIGLCNKYSVAKNIAFKFMKEKLVSDSNKIFLTGDLFDRPNYFLNHKIIASYVVTYECQSVYCSIQLA